MTETAYYSNCKHIGKGKDVDDNKLLKARLLPQVPRYSHPTGL